MALFWLLDELEPRAGRTWPEISRGRGASMTAARSRGIVHGPATTVYDRVQQVARARFLAQAA